MRKSKKAEFLNQVAEMGIPPTSALASSYPVSTKYGVIGYQDNLDDDEIDPDPHFREFLKIVNDEIGVRTVSSCQGHAPGEQYTDVTQAMRPYITLHGENAALRIIARSFRKLTCVASVKTSNGKSLVSMKPEVMGHWDAALAELREICRTETLLNRVQTMKSKKKRVLRINK